MSEDWDAVRQEVVDALPDVGQSASLIVLSGSGDPWNPDVSETIHAVTVVGSSFKHDEIDGTLVKKSDRLFLMSNTKTITPDVSHKLDIGGERYEIVNVMPVQPAETALIWKVQARA